MLTEHHKKTILATVPVLREGGVALTKHFYTRMFTHHPELKNLFNMGNQQSGKQQTALAMAVLAYAENIANPGVLMPVVDMIGHKHNSLNVQPEQYDIVGLHLLASIKEVLQDAATPDVMESWTLAYKQLADLMIGHEQKLKHDKVATEGGWNGWRTFIVNRKIEESTEITSFYLTPKDGKAIPTHIPGQYISIKVFLPQLNLEQIRQYSISCAPNGSNFRISVKREKGPHIEVDGMISDFLHDHISTGNEVEISAPAGNFILRKGENKKVFISGGIGQTPLLSMVEALAINEERPTQIVWIHACRNKDVHAFAENIGNIARNYPTLQTHQFYDSIDATPIVANTYAGHIDFTKIKDWAFDQETEYYVCGPRIFLEKMIATLRNNKVHEEQIFFEEFGPKSL